MGTEPHNSGRTSIRRVATDPDGNRYEIKSDPKEWTLGTGSIVLDAVALAWAVLRRARGEGVGRDGAQGRIRVEGRHDAKGAVGE